ncbi:PadR family transcriptional regulator [Microbacterium sp.]|uniref:PadR family transcriptional regulator n=1 Tax=Microbacterium sp. TaxID=51671 RepID=UPI002E37602B|nr:helix-turn-helix transcriptional regulator [Microbacterium sp.]HEX5728204.1 helix-turn-helix transcriptional regulator [Microbacterium sp.]
MRRRAGQLLPLETDILDTALRLGRAGDKGFHGFAIAKVLAGNRSTLTAHGTLYKALGRLEKAGLLVSEWEDAAAAEKAGRPRRRLYTVTGAGQLALASHRAEATTGAPIGRAAWEAS